MHLARLATFVPVVVAASANATPAHYAALFEQGHRWSYDVELTTFDDRPNVTKRMVVTCEVTTVVTVPSRGLVSRVTCSPQLDADYVEHDYYASPEGLRFIDSGGAPLAKTAKDVDANAGNVVIATRPKAFRKIEHVKMLDTDADAIEGISAEPHGWCVFEDSSRVDADGHKQSRCFTNGIGITSGEFNSSSKGYHIVYKLRPTGLR